MAVGLGKSFALLHTSDLSEIQKTSEESINHDYSKKVERPTDHVLFHARQSY